MISKLVDSTPLITIYGHVTLDSPPAGLPGRDPEPLPPPTVEPMEMDYWLPPGINLPGEVVMIYYLIWTVLGYITIYGLYQ
jgi:hypothetical protein